MAKIKQKNENTFLNYPKTVRYGTETSKIYFAD